MAHRRSSSTVAALAACARQLDDAHAELAQPASHVASFHDAFLEALRTSYDAFVDTTDEWSRTALQRFVSIYFAEYHDPQCYAELWSLLLQQLPLACADTDTSNNNSSDKQQQTLALPFDALKCALQQHVQARLSVQDIAPLTPAMHFDVTQRVGTDELELPRLQLAGVKRSSLPAFPPVAPNTGTAAAIPITRHHSVTTMVSAPIPMPPLLQDYHAEVLKKSRNWLGRWHTRFVFLRFGELEVCKRNVSAHRSVSAIAGSGTSSGSSSTSAATATAAHAAAVAAAKSKRYPLATLLSMQLIALGDAPSVSSSVSSPVSTRKTKQALSLHFTFTAAAHGGQTTKALVLGCDRADTLQTLVTQLATFAMVYGLATGRDAATLAKFVQLGANLDACCVVPHPVAPPGALAPLQLAFAMSHMYATPAAFEAAVQLLVRAGADPRSLLRFGFASHVLFGINGGTNWSGSTNTNACDPARRALLLRESVDGVVFPFGSVVGDDEYQWHLLMYLSTSGDVSGAQQLLATLWRLSRTKCLQYVDHVNAAGDNALHIAIKSARMHGGRAEDLAMLLVAIGTSTSTTFPVIAIDTESDSEGSSSAPKVSNVSTSVSASTASFTDSQLVHCCDGRGESVFHLALKARLWRLVAQLVAANAVDPTSSDRFGNTSLHIAIKVGAPVPLIAAIIERYRPHRPAAFASISTARSRLVTTLGYDTRDRRGNDTALTLAMKYQQQDVVELLLAAGASPNISDALWSLETIPNDAKSTSDVGSPSELSISDGDTPLHVAIKTGLSRAAAALVSHGANVLALDAHGASVLALAVRHGMYALALTVAEQLASTNESGTNEFGTSAASSRAHQLWVDCVRGAPVSHVALQANQLELAALLLDLAPPQLVALRDTLSRETLLHALVRWLANSSKAADTETSETSETSDDDLRAMHSDDAPNEQQSQSTRRERRHLKSRSDGDLRFLRSPTSTGPKVAALPPMRKAASTDCNNAAAAQRTSSNVRDCIRYQKRAAAALLTHALQHCDDVASLAAQSVSGTSVLQLAAAGGIATTFALQLLLAALETCGASRLERARALTQQSVANALPPLHAALAAGAGPNALLLLLALQRIQYQPDDDHKSGSSRLNRDTNTEVDALCSRALEVASGPTGSSPLHLACRWPQRALILAVVDVLLSADVDASSWDASGDAPLHVAVRHACDAQLIELFHRYNQDLNGWTEGISEVSRLGTNADTSDIPDTLDSVDTRKALATPKTALILAVEYRNVAAWRALVACGANVRVVTPRTHLGLLHVAVACRVHSRVLLHALLACRRLVDADVTDCYGRRTADVVAQLQTQLVECDDVSVPLPGSTERGDVFGIKRRTSAVAEEDGDDDASVLVAASAAASESATSVSQLAQDNAVEWWDNSTRRQESDAATLVSDMLVPDGLPTNAPKRAVSSASNPDPSTAQLRARIPPTLQLDAAALAYLHDEERATLTLVAHEARQEAKDWLAKRIGQKKLLSDARAQLQSLQTHRRSSSGSGLRLDPSSASPSGTLASTPIPLVPVGRESEQLLEQYKALAAKRFIDKHVADAVAEARLDIERERQAICQDTGLDFGVSNQHQSLSSSSRRDVFARSTSTTNNGAMHLVPHSRTTRAESDETSSAWWSEYGGINGSSSFVFDTDNASTWLSTPGGRSSTILSESWPTTTTANNGTWLSSVRDVTSGDTSGTGFDTRRSTSESFVDPIDDGDDDVNSDATYDDSFARVIATRKSLT